MAEGTSGLAARLADALERALEPWRRPGPPFVLLLSGGVDSSLLAWELRASGRLTTVTVGVAGSADLQAGESAARRLGVPWQGTVLDGESLERSARKVRAQLVEAPPPIRSILLSLAAAIDASPAPDVLCGQGIDELFLGYAHFAGLDRPEAGRRAESDLERLRRDDWPRSVGLARSLGRELHGPYLTPEFVAAAGAIPLELRMPGSDPKRWFRRWAVERGLPRELADRRKRALQFGSGIDRWWKRRGGSIVGD